MVTGAIVMGLAYLMYAVLGAYALVSTRLAHLVGSPLPGGKLRKLPREAPPSSQSIADVSFIISITSTPTTTPLLSLGRVLAELSSFSSAS